jgi:hypothetical protein
MFMMYSNVCAFMRFGLYSGFASKSLGANPEVIGNFSRAGLKALKNLD